MKILIRSNKRLTYGIQWQCYNCMSEMECDPMEILLNGVGEWDGFVDIKCPVCGQVNHLDCM